VKSYISQNEESGVKILYVFYDRHLDNFDQAIEKGLSEHGLKHGEATVIALPGRCESMPKKALNF